MTSVTRKERPVQHYFAIWSKQLAPEVRTQYEEKLRFLDSVLSSAIVGAPQGLRETNLRSYVLVPAWALETALVALECATVCRQSYPEDFAALCSVMKVVIRGPLPISRVELQRMLEFLAATDPIDPATMPVGEVLGQIERMVAGQSVPDEWRPLLETIHQAVARSTKKPTKSIEALLARINRLSNDSGTARLKADDGWADMMAQDLGHMTDPDRKRWDALLSHASAVKPEPPAKDWDVAQEEIQASIMDLEAYHAEHVRLFFGRRASSAWTEASHERIAAIGVEPFQSLRLKWLHAVPNSKPSTLSQFSVNREILRGLLCTCEHSDDVELARAVRIAAGHLYRSNSPLGRFGVWVLTRMTAANVPEELTYLVRQVKAESQIELIEAARALVASQTGVLLHALTDLPLPTSGFSEFGKRVEWLSGFKAELAVTAVGSVDLRWFKPSGEEQKSIPAQVKRAHEADVRNLKTAIKDFERTLATAREHLELAPVERRSWSFDDWRQRYLDHPVAGTIGRRLLWAFEGDGATTVGAFDGQDLVNREGRPLKLSASARVSVWHPLGSAVGDVIQWREWLAAVEVTQPFKQAHREVYLLTDAERATGTYSNRFAGHVLKQSQFRALAKTRRWDAKYHGPWDSGDEGFAERQLPEWELRAELWTSGAGDEYGGGGGFAYIATDQVRFCRMGSRDPLPLSDVPPFVFSEVMRDVDLFVGVASVGNDPTWQDGGPEGRHAAYWQSYSFGDLSEMAVTRRAVLERIVPRLKIANLCTFSDRFLVVRGELHTYRIHLGSGNIMMDPENTYLCIVPARGENTGGDSTLFLPFEGDSRLSVILSKALLLASDASITDPIIVRQIAPGR
jgi:hypothetical protein